VSSPCAYVCVNVREGDPRRMGAGDRGWEEKLRVRVLERERDREREGCACV